MSIDWTAVWGVAGPAVVGLATWLKMRKPNQAKIESAVAAAKVETATANAENKVVTLLQAEVERLSARQIATDDRIAALEKREGRMIRHIYRLEGLMRGAGLEPPPFEIDGEPIRAGGTDPD